MSSLQPRILALTILSADLITQLSELDRLRDRVKEAQSASRSRRHIRYIKEKRTHVRSRLEFGRDGQFG